MLDIDVVRDIRATREVILVCGAVCYQGKQTGMENILDAWLSTEELLELN